MQLLREHHEAKQLLHVLSEVKHALQPRARDYLGRSGPNLSGALRKREATPSTPTDGAVRHIAPILQPRCSRRPPPAHYAIHSVLMGSAQILAPSSNDCGPV